MEKEITTIEELAEMIQRNMASKEDLKGLAAKEDIKRLEVRLDGVDGRLDHLDARMGRIEADINELPEEIVYRNEFDDVLDRVKYLEKKLGIESGMQPGFAS